MTFIKIPMRELVSEGLPHVCLLTGSGEDVERRFIKLFSAGKWIVIVSSVPLLGLAFLQCITTLLGKVPSTYLLILPIGLAQAVDLSLRRACLKATCVSLPLSRSAYRRCKINRVIIGCLKITTLGSCLTLVFRTGDTTSPGLGSCVVLFSLVLWLAEQRLRLRAIAVHRLEPDALTLRIPEVGRAGDGTVPLVSIEPAMAFSQIAYSNPAPVRAPDTADLKRG